ncbi:Mur ligase family protein [Candidatus Saccharibacteria bacterium]|nr:Mur ligase family protein [Candidatus Saccharibacteria bacterium]
MKKYLSRLNFGYERVLLYMLQQTEYDVREYLRWLRRVTDFREVRKRGDLVLTMKIRLLFQALALFVVIYLATIFAILIIFNQIWLYILALILILVLPVLAQYVIVLPLILGDILIKKPLAKRRIADAKETLKNHPGYKIAIAGSFGKTTAKSVLAAILGGGKKVAATPGNINQPLGFAKFIAGLAGDEEILIFEFGEYRAGDIIKMCDFIQPDAGFITGINDAHLVNFANRDELVADIMDLQKYLGDKPLYLNGDSEILRKFDNKNSTIYSHKGVANLLTKNVILTAFGTEFSLGKMKIESGLLGRHNIGIVAAAVDFAKKLGLNDREIRAGLKTLQSVEHRMKPRILNGAVIIDDTYNGNLDGFRAGIELLRELPATRKIYVTPGLVEQGFATEPNHQEIGRLLATANFDKIVLMKNSATKIIHDELISRNYRGEILLINDPLDFYENLNLFVASGDLVLMQNDWTDNYH